MKNKRNYITLLISFLILFDLISISGIVLLVIDNQNIIWTIKRTLGLALLIIGNVLAFIFGVVLLTTTNLKQQEGNAKFAILLSGIFGVLMNFGGAGILAHIFSLLLLFGIKLHRKWEIDESYKFYIESSEEEFHNLKDTQKSLKNEIDAQEK